MEVFQGTRSNRKLTAQSMQHWVTHRRGPQEDKTFWPSGLQTFAAFYRLCPRPHLVPHPAPSPLVRLPLMMPRRRGRTGSATSACEGIDVGSERIVEHGRESTGHSSMPGWDLHRCDWNEDDEFRRHHRRDCETQGAWAVHHLTKNSSGLRFPQQQLAVLNMRLQVPHWHSGRAPAEF